MKNRDFAVFNVRLIHRKQVPLLHNTVVILCDDGGGLVAVSVQLLFSCNKVILSRGEVHITMQL